MDTVRWIRFRHGTREGFGRLEEGERIAEYEGDMFDDPRPTARRLALGEVTVLVPCAPSKMIAVWNNYHELAARLGLAVPEEPLYLFKAPSSFLAHGQTIHSPDAYDGNVVFEGELGVVIGRRCKEVSEQDAQKCIFGFTCINDVTASQIINRDPAFPQWSRAKSFDTFGVFGPVIATGLDPATLRVRTVVDGHEHQDYPTSDMVFPPARLVSRIARDMTLEPGDVIACGTSVGVGSLRPGCRVSVSIEGIGTLENPFA